MYVRRIAFTLYLKVTLRSRKGKSKSETREGEFIVSDVFADLA